MKVQKPMTNLKALSLMILLIAFVGHSNTQVETKIGMKQQIAKMEELIKQEFQMVKTYPEKPAYYVQENKSGCRIVVKVDDIPLGYNFAKDEGQTMLYPINDHLFGSGEHILSVEVYPLTTQQTISADTWVNLKVILFPEKNGNEREMIAELNVPRDIGKQKLPVYCDSINFKSTLPFDHKQVLNTAKDLRRVSYWEAKVLAHYNKVRDMMIAGKYYEYNKMWLTSTWVLTDMHYLTEENLESTY